MVVALLFISEQIRYIAVACTGGRGASSWWGMTTSAPLQRSYGYFPPRPIPRDFASLSGLAQIQRLLAGETPAPPISATLEFSLIEAGEGFATFEGTPGDWAYNPLGTVHGGWVSTILDSALGCAVHTILAPGQGYTTATLEVKFLRALTATTGRVRAEGRVIHAGKRTAVSEARLLDPAGKVLALGTSTCVIL